LTSQHHLWFYFNVRAQVILDSVLENDHKFKREEQKEIGQEITLFECKVSCPYLLASLGSGLSW
jgi:hypothetical protein